MEDVQLLDGVEPIAADNGFEVSSIQMDGSCSANE